ncbi:DUF305 domain-containing protein [Agrococcus beijingensis]|uniref:DUF305 domain-containing protein n=1 Tax=Agrococcus beijingensis TaxID=3068634 RepID=UPI002741B044|nr:DUF305 domain-containing protein [Agrococcus sp. REN33]
MTFKFRALAVSAIAVPLVLTGCATSAGPALSSEPASPSPSATATAQAAFNQADVVFASGMIVHHQQAIMMSEMLLAKDDVDQGVAELAERIRAAQQPEIQTLEAMLAEWGADASEHAGMDHGGDSGMMSESDMALLEATPGPEASRLFLEQMIMHHEGAVEMSQTELTEGQNAEALEMAQRIIDDQSAEIAEMESLLAGL